MNKLATERPYMRRHPVARFFRIGSFKVGGIDRTLWGFMSFWNGVGQQPTFACFARLADVDTHGNIRTENCQEGDIIVEPGIVYRPIPPMDVTGKMMAEHERAMKNWKPKTQLIYEKDTTQPAVDVGVINLTGMEKLNG